MNTYDHMLLFEYQVESGGPKDSTCMHEENMRRLKPKSQVISPMNCPKQKFKQKSNKNPKMWIFPHEQITNTIICLSRMIIKIFYLKNTTDKQITEMGARVLNKLTLHHMEKMGINPLSLWLKYIFDWSFYMPVQHKALHEHDMEKKVAQWHSW